MNPLKPISFFSVFFIAVASYADTNTEGIEIRVPKTITFLPVPIGTRVKIVNGVFEAFKDGSYSSSNLSASFQKQASLSSSSKIILGAPASVKDFVVLDPRHVNNNNKMPTAAAFAGNSLITIVSDRVQRNTGVESHFSVFAHNGDFKQIAEFKLRENPYNLCLDEAYAVSPNLVAILLQSSRNPYINAVIFFDVRLAKAIGYREYSRMQYLPEHNAIWLAQEVPNCDNLTEVLKYNEIHASIIPIFNDGKLNPELSETAELGEVELKK